MSVTLLVSCRPSAVLRGGRVGDAAVGQRGVGPRPGAVGVKGGRAGAKAGLPDTVTLGAGLVVVPATVSVPLLLTVVSSFSR